MKKRGKFDYILLETSGLADPGPVASIFWLDKALGADVFLDGIVTVVDAKYGLSKLQALPEEEEEKQSGPFSAAVRQVALADFVILNKTDLAGGTDRLEQTVEAIKAINAQAPLEQTSFSK